jgi:hypothetical protein
VTNEPVSATRRRLLRLIYWTTPSLLCLLLYWFGFRAWFQKDDFAWLALHLRVHDVPSFFSALFQPMAQGTIRPWSERLYFLAGWWLFGMESPPFRAVAFVTMFANLVLLTAIARRTTGSAVAGLAAPVLWIVNGNLYTPMAWSSAYNQILCAFFLLAALLCWIRYTETGNRRFLIAQWISFLLGFGALEINAVYPALAALYAICRAPAYLRRTLPMFLVSAAYTVLHRAVAPPRLSDTYRMYFDAGLFESLGRYLLWSFGADRYAWFQRMPVWPFYAAEALIAICLAAFAVAVIRRGDRLPLFCIGWFFLTLAPVLPLKNHVSDYYLTIPLAGLAILGGWAVASARGRYRAIATVLVLLYLLPSAWMARGMTQGFYDISRRAAKLVRSVMYAHRQHPDSVLVVSGVDTDLFWQCWRDRPFVPFGLRHVYLAAGSETRIPQLRPETRVAHYVLPETAALAALRARRLEVYELVASGGLRSITPFYRARLERRPPRLPTFLDIRDPVSEPHLGEGWWPAEESHRWSRRRARFQLRPEGTQLVLRGVSPDSKQLSVTVGGETRTFGLAPGSFEVRTAVAPQVMGRPSADIAIAVDKVSVFPNDGRELGVAFGTAEITR